MHNHLEVKTNYMCTCACILIHVLTIDPSKKSAFFSSVKRLVEVTRGHNLFFSSEALRALEIRKPADLRIL